LTDDGLLDLSDLGSSLTGRTKLLAITGMSNSLGTLPPLKELVDAAHAVGALVLVDGAQLVPHVPVDVTELDCDFLTISGHKMLGPTASGGLYGKLEHLEAMDVFLGGGHMIEEVFPDHSTWNAVPYKFEAGTMNLGQEVGLGAAIDYLEDLGMEAVREHEQEITAYAIDRLLDAGAEVYGPKDVSVRGGAVSFWYKDTRWWRAWTRPPACSAEGGPVALDEIYKEVILDHYKNPRNKREMPSAELSCSKNNPLCGDEITVYVHEEDGTVLDVSFVGQGCSISQSSASMMTETVAGKRRDEVEAQIGSFRGMMAGEVEPDEDVFGELVALKGVVKYPVRVKCAVLGWDTLQAALAGEGQAAGSAPH
jgi:SUF system NifU family Fe-S assembly protein